MGTCHFCDSLLDSFGLCPNHCDELGGGGEHTDSELWNSDDYRDFDDIIDGYRGDFDMGRDSEIY